MDSHRFGPREAGKVFIAASRLFCCSCVHSEAAGWVALFGGTFVVLVVLVVVVLAGIAAVFEGAGFAAGFAGGVETVVMEGIVAVAGSLGVAGCAAGISHRWEMESMGPAEDVSVFFWAFHLS